MLFRVLNPPQRFQELC